MDSFLKDSPHEAFTIKWIKHKLQEQLQDEIVITEIVANQMLLLFEQQQATAKMLQNCTNEQRRSNPTG